MPTSSATCNATSSGAVPERPDAWAPTRTLMPTTMSRLAFATSTASWGAMRRISSLSPTMIRDENAKNAGERDVQVGEDAHAAALDHVLAEAGEVARTCAACIGRGRDARGAAELLSVNAERRAAPVDVRMQVDQSRGDDRAGHVANVGTGIRFEARSDAGDFTLRECDVVCGIKLLRRIDHAAPAQDEIVTHSWLPPG